MEQLAGALLPVRRHIAEKRVDVYDSVEMKSGINVEQLAASKQVLAALVRIPEAAFSRRHICAQV